MTTTITEQVRHYVEMKQKLGYIFSSQALTLHNFARFAQSRGETVVKSETVLCWATASAAVSQPRQAVKLQVVRAFACWMNVSNNCHEIPPLGLLGVFDLCQKTTTANISRQYPKTHGRGIGFESARFDSTAYLALPDWTDCHHRHAHQRGTRANVQ